MPLLGCWLLGGFVVQVIVGLLDLKGGSATGGNTFLIFSAFFMLVSGMGMFVKYQGILSGNPLDARIDGYAWSMLSLVVLLWTPAYFKPRFSLLSVLVLCLDVACPVIALTDLGLIPKSASHIAAWALLVAGVVAVYYSAALIVNQAYGKKIFPMP